MNTEMTQEQEARATKIRQMAYELGLLMREHAEDCFPGWDAPGANMFPTAWLVKTTHKSMNTGFNDFFALAE